MKQTWTSLRQWLSLRRRGQRISVPLLCLLLLALTACGQQTGENTTPEAETEAEEEVEAGTEAEAGTQENEAETVQETEAAEVVPAAPADFEYEIEDGHVVLTRYNGNETTVVVPSEIEGLPVVSLRGYSGPNSMGFGYTVGVFPETTTNVILPDSVTTIGYYAFYNLVELTSLVLPTSVETIEGGAFKDCTALRDLTIPDSVTEIKRRAFEGCDSLPSLSCLEYVLREDHAELIGYSGKDASIVLPAEIRGLPLTIITGESGPGAYGFGYTETVFPSYMERVVIPDSVETIGEHTFHECRDLKEVQIPYSVTKIGTGAFQNCVSLERIEIPDSVTRIDGESFSGCDSLRDVRLSNTMDMICEETFEGCDSLSEIRIPDSVTEIDYEAFDGCTALTSVDLPKDLRLLGAGAFRDCTGLTEVALPASLGWFGENSSNGNPTVNGFSSSRNPFSGCTSLRSLTVSEDNTRLCAIDGVLFSKNREVLYCYPSGKEGTSYVIPDGVTSVEDSAFYGCENLREIILPSSVAKLERYSFSESGIERMEIPDSVTTIIDGAFDSCLNLISIQLSVGLDRICYGMFDGCASLESVSIPDGAEFIGDFAFARCPSLVSVTIPVSVTSIGYDAFMACENLSDIYYAGTREQWDAITIDSGNEALDNATIHCAG